MKVIRQGISLQLHAFRAKKKYISVLLKTLVTVVNAGDYIIFGDISSFNPSPAGGPGFPRPAGGWCLNTPPPSNSAPGPRSDTGQTAFERASKIRKKSLR